MTRYFQSFVTARPLVVDGQPFIFERVEPMGGSWLGVLAVDDESSANKLAAAGLEITKDAYEGIKKKVMEAAMGRGSALSRTPLPAAQTLAASASRAGPRGSSGVSAPIVAPANGETEAAPSVRPLTSVSLLTTSRKPPVEPMLETDNGRSPSRKAA